MLTFRSPCLTLLTILAFVACSSSGDGVIAPGDALTVSLTASPTSVSSVGAITLTASPQGADVRAVEFYGRHVGVDTVSLLARDTLPPYVATRDVSTLGDNGNWEFTAKAFDAQGHVATSPSVTAVVDIVDNRPLTATFTASQSRITVPGHFTFTVNSNKLLASAAVYHGDTKVAELATPQNPAVLTVNVTSSDNGTNSYVVKAVDGSGAVVASTPMTVVVDIRWTIIDRHVAPAEQQGNVGDMFVATDGAGEIYVAVPTFSNDAYLAKYDAAGKQLWSRAFGGPDYESVYSVSVDPSGRVYLAGSVGYPNQPYHGDCWVTVYDGSGTLLQTRIIHKSTISTGGCRAATDNAGNLYVLGATSTPSETFLAKYDRDGTELWTQHFSTSTANDDPTSLAVDPLGGVYVCGSTSGSFDGSPPRGAGRDVWVMKFDGGGNRQWATQYGVAGFLTWCQRVAADPLGGVYVAGVTDAEERFTPAQDAVVMRLDANGGIAWVKKFDSGGEDAAESVAADPTGAYLVGHIALGDTSHFFTEPTQNPRGGGFLMKLSRDGNVLFTRLLTAELMSDALTSDGDVLVAGYGMLARHHDPMP